tara:strand:- start:2011 stop:2826 length:816 start_codon:yes stop_codon:yes gene_type:complete
VKLIYLFIFFVISAAQAQIDIVFDIDWTLVYPVDETMKNEARVYLVQGEYYRVSDGAVEVIASLFKDPRFRVSFFSGGDKLRNEELLKQIILPLKDKTALDVAYKVLSREDLSVVSTDENLGFSERFKKDLTIVNKDLNQVVLVDDLKNFTPSGQEDNLLWVGKTYTYQDKFKKLPLSKYIPDSELSWLNERYKFFWVYSSIEEAASLSIKTGSSFKNVLNKVLEKKQPQRPSNKIIREALDVIVKLSNQYEGAKIKLPVSFINCEASFIK